MASFCRIVNLDYTACLGLLGPGFVNMSKSANQLNPNTAIQHCRPLILLGAGRTDEAQTPWNAPGQQAVSGKRQDPAAVQGIGFASSQLPRGKSFLVDLLVPPSDQITQNARWRCQQ